uniref:Lactoylglutathione lyase n=1 Tax=Nodulisporium sp. TaxID=1897413 RepID=A0A2R4QEZ7_9PEZI|nr:glyoxalase I [Nodulisporium sp.]
MTDISTYQFNHSMIRVKDPEASLKFYKLLGLSVLQELKLPDYGLDLYFVAYDSPASTSHSKLLSDREGVIELNYTYGIKKTHSGNEDPKGFGHICVSVDNIQAACNRLADAGCEFQSTLRNGSAFVLDPDGYWIQLIAHNAVHETEQVAITDVQSYRVNHTMLRVKDKGASLRFYEGVLGMTLQHEHRNAAAGFDSVFLGYGPSGAGRSIEDPNPDADREGLLELNWTYGTEKGDGVAYHNGNSEPEGFGHICISVDDIYAACERLEALNVRWQKRLMDGPFRVAFAYDPDDYLVEVIQNERFKSAGHEY